MVHNEAHLRVDFIYPPNVIIMLLEFVSNVALLPFRTQLIELNSTSAHNSSATFETSLASYTAVGRLGFKRRATAVPNSIHKV